MADAKRKHNGTLTAHIKAAVIAAAGGKPGNIDELNPYRDPAPIITVKPSQFFNS